jgi:hypothetical protein
MAGVAGQHGAEVWFAGDEHAVGEFGSAGECESLGEAVRPGAAWRTPHDFDADIGQGGVKR